MISQTSRKENQKVEEEPTSEREPEQQGQQEGGEGQVSSNPQVNRVVPGGPTDSVKDASEINQELKNNSQEEENK